MWDEVGNLLSVVMGEGDVELQGARQQRHRDKGAVEFGSLPGTPAQATPRKCRWPSWQINWHAPAPEEED